MGVKEKWQKRFMKSLREEERKVFRLWLDFSEGQISEKEFKTRMNMDIMPRVLGKKNAVRLDTLEREIDNLDRRLLGLEKKTSSRSC
ncbi:MAG: hypothetical protein JSV57_03655 [Candidatus Bathyarchaeota archaeon]|nr:MAG: hypothetical protein JSV57_03655 [Candidatus Bathyarchaeota archaeon]